MYLPASILGCLVALFTVLPLIIDVNAHNMTLGTSQNTGHSDDIASNFQDHAPAMEHVLDDTTATYASAVSRIEHVEHFLSHMIDRTQIIKASIVEQHGESLDDSHDILAVEMGKLADDIREVFPPPDQADNRSERKLKTVILLKIEEKVADIFIQKAMLHGGLSEDGARSLFEVMRPHILNIIVPLGDLIEKHLVVTGVFVAVVVVVYKLDFLIHLFNVFEFGPSGTLKGSPAAWAQSLGSIIPMGNCFARFRATSMG